MRNAIIGVGTAWLVGGAALAQEGRDGGGLSQRYWAAGVEVGAGGDLCIGDEDGDSDCDGGGGIGAYGRIGRRANRFLGAEAEAGLVGIGGSGALGHATAMGVLRAPLGPVDVRARGGLGFAATGGSSVFGPAVGLDLGVRAGRDGTVRLGATTIIGDSDDDEIAVLLQLGYQRAL